MSHIQDWCNINALLFFFVYSSATTDSHAYFTHTLSKDSYMLYHIVFFNSYAIPMILHHPMFKQLPDFVCISYTMAGYIHFTLSMITLKAITPIYTYYITTTLHFTPLWNKYNIFIKELLKPPLFIFNCIIYHNI